MGLGMLLVACVAGDPALNEAPPGFDGAAPPDEPFEDAGRLGAFPRWEGLVDAPPLSDPSDPEFGASAAAAFFAEGTLWDLDLSLPSASRASLSTEKTTWVPAELTADGVTYPVQTRLKGTGSFRDLSGKAAFKFNFADTDPEARFHGLERVTLGNMMQDPTMMGEHVAYWLHRRRGVPAPRHTYARLTVDGSYFGLYSVVETMDEQLLKRAFPGDNNGNLYEANVSDFVRGKTDHFELEETDGLYVPYDDIDAVIATLEATSDADYLTTLRALFDLDTFLEMMAIELATANVDGYAMFANNYMAYHGEDRWHVMPWGHDQCFDWDRDVRDYSSVDGVLLRRCVDVPACLALLDTKMLALMDDWESGELATLVDATAALIQADCAADPRAELPCDPAKVAWFVEQRPRSVRESLGP